MTKQLFEPRWDLAGNPIPGVPVTLAPGLGCERLSARYCGNLPKCYGCQRQIERDQFFYSVAAQYVTRQPTGNVVADYVWGGTYSAARATICETCAPKLCGDWIKQ